MAGQKVTLGDPRRARLTLAPIVVPFVTFAAGAEPSVTLCFAWGPAPALGKQWAHVADPPNSTRTELAYRWISRPGDAPATAPGLMLDNRAYVYRCREIAPYAAAFR